MENICNQHLVKDEIRNKESNSLALDSFNVRQTNYENGVSYKFDNRRVTIWKEEDECVFGFEFRTMDRDPKPKSICNHLRGKMAVTTIKLSQEAAELVMLSLAKQMGFKVVK